MSYKFKKGNLMSYNKTKKQVSSLLLLLTILCFNGCNHKSTEASIRCGKANNSDTICEINVTSISGEADYLTFPAPPSLQKKDISLSLELYHQEGGGVNVWIKDSKQYISKLIHYTDRVTMPETVGNKMIVKTTKKETWKLSGEAKIEEEFGKSIFKIYIEPRRELFFKKAKNIRMMLRYKTKD